MPFHIQNKTRNKKMCTDTVPQQTTKTTITQALPQAEMQKRNLNNPTEKSLQLLASIKFFFLSFEILESETKA